MYNFEKIENEEILLISDESLLKISNGEKNISTIITNKRLLLLDYPEKTNNYEESLRTSRGSHYILKKEPILIINIEDIDEIIEEKKFNKYVLKDSNYFYLNDDAIRNKLKELI